MILRSLGCHRRGGLSELPRFRLSGNACGKIYLLPKKLFLRFPFMPISINQKIFLTDQKRLHVHRGAFDKQEEVISELNSYDPVLSSVPIAFGHQRIYLLVYPAALMPRLRIAQSTVCLSTIIRLEISGANMY